MKRRAVLLKAHVVRTHIIQFKHLHIDLRVGSDVGQTIVVLKRIRAQSTHHMRFGVVLNSKILFVHPEIGLIVKKKNCLSQFGGHSWKTQYNNM